MTARDLVYRIVSHIPRGRVMTYGDVARLAGIRSSRPVGHFLHTNEDWRRIPCHRVVNAAGRVAPAFGWGGARVHASRLRREGVTFRREGTSMRPALVHLKRHHWKPTRLFKLYLNLFRRFGDPGPWPWFWAKGASATGGGQDRPHTPEEIAIGAILTQNTNWKNVEKAITNLRRDKSCALHPLTCLTQAKLRRLIRPSGFYRQKADRLARFAKTVARHGTLKRFLQRPTEHVRHDLLAVNGIGPETADTILLYAGNHPIFVIDAYTKRFVREKKLSDLDDDYDALQRFFTKRLPVDIQLYKDYHALIVAWGKAKKRKSHQ